MKNCVTCHLEKYPLLSGKTSINLKRVSQQFNHVVWTLAFCIGFGAGQGMAYSSDSSGGWPIWFKGRVLPVIARNETTGMSS